MNKFRGVLWSAFLLLIASHFCHPCGASIWDRAHDPNVVANAEIRFCAYDCIFSGPWRLVHCVAYGLCVARMGTHLWNVPSLNRIVYVL